LPDTLSMPAGYDSLDPGGPRQGSDWWRATFTGAPFETFDQERLSNPQRLDREGMVAYFASMGWIADLPDAERLPLIDRVSSLLTAPEYRRAWETHVHRTRRT
jgi:hypothetical protein